MDSEFRVAHGATSVDDENEADLVIQTLLNLILLYFVLVIRELNFAFLPGLSLCWVRLSIELEHLLEVHLAITVYIGLTDP